MYTVILGGGLIGTGIARWLIEAGSEVTIIENNSDKVDLINSSLGDIAIIGDALKIRDLEKDGIEICKTQINRCKILLREQNKRNKD